MKALIQRVNKASVSVAGNDVGCIDRGLVVFIGVESGDNEKDVNYLVDKIVDLRIFTDNGGKFNLSCRNIHGSILIVSQFTLIADTRRGRRPSFTNAAAPDIAEHYFNMFVERVRSTGLPVSTGVFKSYMAVEIHNDGPVTIMIDSRDR